MTKFAEALRPHLRGEAVTISIRDKSSNRSLHAFGVVERVWVDDEVCHVFFEGNSTMTSDIRWSVINEDVELTVNRIG